MNSLPVAIRTVRWMVRDTFRQSLASKLFWVMLGLTVLCTVFCLGMSVNTPGERERHPYEIPDFVPKGADPNAAKTGVPETGGKMSLAFGLFELEVPRFREDAVRYFQLVFAGLIADTVGVLLALIWTAGFLPTFLEPHAVTVLLAKPTPRWSLVVGKYLGVVLFVALHAVLFVGGTWMGMGISTGVWEPAYWLAVPLLVINFAVFYSFSTLLAVCTRSTVVAIFGTLLFWLMCWAINFTHHKLVGHDVPGVSRGSSVMIEAAYWTLPKPVDMSKVFFDAMGAQKYSAPLPEVEAVREKGRLHLELSVLTSLVFAGVILAIAVYEFRTMDY
jgi:ABC-type transport system involved in multi-copper enzyme maturation permease subunit